jgi:hypothetical protein
MHISEAGLDQGKPKIRMENTYKLDPDEDTLFRSKRVEDTVNKLLEKELCNEKYNESRCKSLACDLSVRSSKLFIYYIYTCRIIYVVTHSIQHEQSPLQRVMYFYMMNMKSYLYQVTKYTDLPFLHLGKRTL